MSKVYSRENTTPHHISPLQCSQRCWPCNRALTLTRLRPLEEISNWLSYSLTSVCNSLVLPFHPCPPSVRWLVAWEEPPGTYTALTTTSRWTRPSVTQMRSLGPSRSVLPSPVPLSTTASASMTSRMDIHRTPDAILATAAGTCPQQTTSGGLDPGAQYVQHVNFLGGLEQYRSIGSCGRFISEWVCLCTYPEWVLSVRSIMLGTVETLIP